MEGALAIADSNSDARFQIINLILFDAPRTWKRACCPSDIGLKLIILAFRIESLGSGFS